MTEYRTANDVEAWFASRVLEFAGRERDAWEEYLLTIRGIELDVYQQAEPLAWRRLRRQIAQLAHDRRRDEFERDRAVAELNGLRLAS
jgi:predicted component of type VI protein secretion system